MTMRQVRSTNQTPHEPTHDRERSNHMGASRDLTAGGRAGTATLTRPRREERTRRVDGYAPAPTERPQRRVAPHIPRPVRTGRLGSQQVVSVRGRQIAVPKDTKRRFSTVTLIAVPLLVGGIVLAMVLSGLATNQSFHIQQLQSQERALTNEVESLNRDVETLRSSAELARRAAAAGMVVPAEPGILAVAADGNVEERRPANPEATRRVVDVNGTAATTGGATSDRQATSELGRSLTPVPGGNVLGRPYSGQNAGTDVTREHSGAAAPQPAAQPQGNLAPYAPNVPSAP